MLTCDQCRSSLLDRQYGLLDAADSAAVETHLANCPACQAEQRAMERFSRLLSAAARSEFPAVRFVAPADVAPAAPKRDDRAPFRRLRVAANRLAWAVAVCLAVAVAIPIGSHFTTAARQEAELAAARAKYDTLDRHR